MHASAATRVLARHRDRVRGAVRDFAAASRAYARGDHRAFEDAARRIAATAADSTADEREALRGEDPPDDLARQVARERLLLVALRDWAVDVEARRPEVRAGVLRSWTTLTDSAVLILGSHAAERPGAIPPKWLEACRVASASLAAALAPQGCASVARHLEAAVETAAEPLG